MPPHRGIGGENEETVADAGDVDVVCERPVEELAKLPVELLAASRAAHEIGQHGARSGKQLVDATRLAHEWTRGVRRRRKRIRGLSTVQLILVTRRRQVQRARHLGAPSIAIAGLLVAATVVGAFWLGTSHTLVKPASAPAIDPSAMRKELSQQRAQVERAVGDARHDLDALALRLSELQARAIRLDALGGRLVEMTGMDAGEFSFDRAPPRGGAAPDVDSESMGVADFISALEGLEERLELRGQELAALESVLLSGRVAQELAPSGRPVVNSWISSTFGRRTDPVTGQQSMHNGVDFAGKRGSPIRAVAGGVVIFAGVRSGLGNVVEIDHGRGYVTRYAHNLENLVRRGQRVAKGEHIALLGSSGRSTGNHVHLEVLYEGRAIDPMPFIRAARARSAS